MPPWVQVSQLAKPRPASSYPQVEGSVKEDLIAHMQAMGLASPGQPEANGNHLEDELVDDEAQPGMPPWFDTGSCCAQVSAVARHGSLPAYARTWLQEATSVLVRSMLQT